MQALYVADGRLSYRQGYPKPEPGPGEALVRVRLAGICATDLEIVKGYGGFKGVLGHEFVGQVEAATEEPSWVGKRVVGTINLGCWQCRVCLGEGPEHCPQRTVLGIIQKDGIFADYVTLPLVNLRPVPDEVPDEEAVFTEPLAAALRIREQLVVPPTARVAVVGPGRLGMLIGQVLALAGTRVTMLGRLPASLALPAQLGLETGLAGDMADDSFDFVVEATGNEAGLAHSLRLVRPLGTLVMKSTFAGAATMDLSKLVVGEITVVGSRCGPFEPALRLLAQGKIAVRRMIEAEYPLAEGTAALTHAARPGVRKVLLRP
ncbi:MAG: alcohol dehydrogenase catalytic domain-containing protein [Chloroflexi bacterium]|nr:alcohol dehydrogenase catalytic domain-containing protein [Chloroflexota bacterium]MCI0579416.1 alcohol dehydrogenase catalytic domain-containing protein [Chloroflexota bacterium]MCI0648954.1 alcohol dehydrogenase catalytic domain-containing protein [Chloroflexota bacterium]MCI0725819.1 alcohol dehydrogenase catalytic domain-containing protein [Chloroflexota bacterium]